MAIYTSGLICQLAIQSTDGVMSAIQIVDRIIVDLPEDVPLGNMVIQPVPCWAILVFKSEDPEEFNVGFTAIAPGGTRLNQSTFFVKLPGGAGGFQMRLGINIDPRNVGIWWFEVTVRGVTVFRMPLEIFPGNPVVPHQNPSG